MIGDQRLENFLLAFEIGIKSTQRYSRPIGDPADGGFMVTLFHRIRSLPLAKASPGCSLPRAVFGFLSELET